jgi:hypothetical protein
MHSRQVRSKKQNKARIQQTLTFFKELPFATEEMSDSITIKPNKTKVFSATNTANVSQASTFFKELPLIADEKIHPHLKTSALNQYLQLPAIQSMSRGNSNSSWLLLPFLILCLTNLVGAQQTWTTCYQDDSSTGLGVACLQANLYDDIPILDSDCSAILLDYRIPPSDMSMHIVANESNCYGNNILVSANEWGHSLGKCLSDTLNSGCTADEVFTWVIVVSAILAAVFVLGAPLLRAHTNQTNTNETSSDPLNSDDTNEHEMRYSGP